MLATMQTYQTKIKEVKLLTMHTCELVVELVDPPEINFMAGQYMQFKIGEILRSFSIIDIPDRNRTLKFCIGLYEHGVASDFLRKAKVGSDLEMQGPMGNFTVEDFGKNYFFVATGVGVAPFVSIIPDMLGRGYDKKLHLLFGVRHEEDVFFFDRFSHLHNLYPNFTFTPIVSRPKYHWPGEHGRVTTYIDIAYEYYRDYIFYISGAEAMVKDMRELLLKKGHSLDNIKLEIFI